MFVQIFASSAWTGVVCVIGAANVSNSCAARSPDAAPTPPTMHGSVSISSKKRPAAMRSGTWATNTSTPTCRPRCLAMYPATKSVVPGATVERSTIVWPGRRCARRSSRAERMSRMSISMCENDGVPSVMTMLSARAASATESDSSRRPDACTRSSASWAPGSSKGMRPAATAARRSGSASTPSTFRPRSANESASGSPIRPMPMTETSMDTSGRLAAVAAGTTAARQLRDEARDEARVVAQVAPPQTARLLCEAERPLQARRLHPARCLGHEAGVEVERGADAHEDGRIEAPAHRGHPLLLLRHADPDPHDVRAGAVDLVRDRVELGVVEVAERRRAAADDPEAGELPAEVQRELDQGALVAPAVEEDPSALLCRALAVAQHEVGAVDAVGQRAAERAQRPDERLAVGDDEAGAEHGVHRLGGLLGDHPRAGCGDAERGPG